MVYDNKGNPKWDKMWDSYCDLAAEGGPSHRGEKQKLTFSSNFTYSQDVINEITRGLLLLGAKVSKHSNGKVYIDMTFTNKAKWFCKIINMENVEAMQEGKFLILPWSGEYELESEIKSIMTVWGKAQHYWKNHRPFKAKLLILLFGIDPYIRE